MKITFGSHKPKYKRITSQYSESAQKWVEGVYDVELSSIFFDKKCTDKKIISNIKNWLINEQIFFYDDIIIDSNYELNCDGSIKIETINQSLPSFIQFNDVKGEFTISGGKINTLHGVPRRIGSRFCCSHNKLQTLEYAPLVVGYNCNYSDYCNFNCSNNELISLEFSPTIVIGDYFCYKNKLQTLEGIQSVLNGNLICNNNKLTTIKHAPNIIKGDFNVSNNLLTNIDDCNSVIDGNFICKKNLILK